MRLSISAESVTALREFANVMPTVLSNMADSTTNLLNVFKSVAESIGPHEQEFFELFNTVSKAQEAASEAISELPYMLNCTADKMESYIGHGSSIGSAILAEQIDISQKYTRAALERLNSDQTNAYAKKLYDTFANNIRIVDYEFKGTPFYNSLSNGIKLNAMADLHNPTGNLSTYFHEVGHMLDDYAGNGHAWLSSDQLYRECLERDVSSYINKVMVDKHCDIDDAYDYISDEISGDWCANVSDIFGSLTQCKCQGDWGHHYTYWNADTTRVEKEAFANMFESSVGSEEKTNMMKKYFPTAYARFESLLRSGCND
jgi:hypothetical protein